MTNTSEPSAMAYKSWPNDAGFTAEVEQREPLALQVSGKIPSIAAGTLYRVGPGTYKLKDTARGDFAVSHWFDAFTHVHRFQLIETPEGNCEVIYNSRRQVDELVDQVRKTGKLNQITFAQKRDPCQSFFQKLKTVFQPTSSNSPQNANVAVTVAPNYPGIVSASESLGGKRPTPIQTLTTLTDANIMKNIDPETLEPMGVCDQKVLHPELTGQLSAAHAQFDPITGDAFNYNMAIGRTATYRVFKTSPATGETEILATIKGDGIHAAYIHSFFLTEDFVILAIWPSYLAGNGAKILWERNILDAIAPFDPKAETTWLVVDRRHGRGLVAKFKSPAAFSFHSINAWQETHDGTTDIFCDLVQYPNMDILHRFYYENLASTGPGVQEFLKVHHENVHADFTQYKLSGIVSSAENTPDIQEFRQAEITKTLPNTGELPTMNPSYSTKKSRFVYALLDRGLSSLADGIVKTDLESGESVFWEHSHHTPGEPIFVEDPKKDGEDDGIVLSVILNGDTGTSYLLCLNAKTMKELGRAEVPFAVGLGFHGRHIAPAAEISSRL